MHLGFDPSKLVGSRKEHNVSMRNLFLNCCYSFAFQVTGYGVTLMLCYRYFVMSSFID